MADGRVTIKTNVDDKSLKDLRSTLKDLENAFKALQSIDPFSGISQEARKLMNEFTGLSSSAEQVDRDIDEIDGKSMEDVSKKASDAGSSLDDTAQSADKADASIDDIDAKSMDDVSKKAGDASSGLEDTASSADKADASLDDVDGTSLDKVSKEADKAGKSVEKADKDVNKFSFSLKDVAKSAVVISAVSKAFDILVSSLDDAITRFDTLNTFPRTMNLLGYETAVVDRSTRSLVRGIEGLPTKLDDIIQTTQRLGGMTGDLDDATETALALNNAFLASGSSAMDAARGTEQYIQMLGNGKVDMQSWRTLTESMNYALIQAANSFGYTGPSALQQFYSALQSGDVTFDQFNKKMQELNNAQGGFAELALVNSEGIATSWANIKTAISRNVANIITVIDDMVQSITGKNIAQNLNNFKFVIDDVFSFAISIIRGTTPVIEGVWKSFELLLKILRPVAPAIYAVVAALITMRVVNEISGWFKGLGVAVTAVTKAMQIYIATQGATTVSIQGMGLATKALATIMGLASGQIKLTALAMTGFQAVLTAITGPVGWVVAGIGALIGVGIGLYNIFVKASDETQALGKSLKDTADETAELNDLVDQTASSYEKTKEATDAQFDSVRGLAEETANLAQKEMLSAGEKKILKDNIDELNESVDGLNLAYDEEQGRLVASNDAMLERIKMAEEDAKYNDARERSTEIQEQHAEATALLARNEEELAEAQEHLDGLAWYQSSGEAKEGVEQLKEENARLVEQIKVLAEEQGIANAEMINSANAVAEAEEASIQQRITSLEGLPPAQSAVIQSMQDRYRDLETTTTEMFDRIEGKSAISIEEMNANLKHNQEMVAQWSENLATLSEQGVDQGLLDQLARLGPEGAPYVQELVDATPDQLAELEENFKKGGDVAKQGLFDSMGIDESDVIDGVPELATRTEQGLREAFEGSGLRNVIPDELEKSEERMVRAGKNIALGAARGVDQGKGEAVAASLDLGKSISAEFMKSVGIQSPSTVFRAHGVNISEGLTQGIKSSGTSAVTAIKLLTSELNRAMRESLVTLNTDSNTGFERFVRTIEQSFKKAVNTIRIDTRTMQNVTRTGFNAVYNNVRSSMNRVPPLVQSTMNRSTQSMRSASSQSQTAGRQLGMGFYWGLNSTAGSIYSLATTIARNAVSRINNALKVRSPSREGFASGGYLGEGLWLGMKSQVGNVEKWSDKLGQSALLGMLKPAPLGMNARFTPAMAGGYTGTTDSRTIHHDNGVTIHIENIENHTDSDIPRILEESAWIIGRERSRLDD